MRVSVSQHVWHESPMWDAVPRDYHRVKYTPNSANEPRFQHFEDAGYPALCRYIIRDAFYRAIGKQFGGTNKREPDLWGESAEFFVSWDFTGYAEVAGYSTGAMHEMRDYIIQMREEAA